MGQHVIIPINHVTVVIALSSLTLVNMGTTVLSIGTTDGLIRHDITDGDEIESKNICSIRTLQFYLTPFAVQNVDRKIVNGV